MTQLTEEQQERLKQIREQHQQRIEQNRDDTDSHFDIDFLLSLLDSDSQAADRSARDLAVEWSQSTSDDGISVDDINRLARLIDLRVTSMRDKCVEKMRAMRDRFQTAADASSLPNDLTASRDAAVAAAFTRLLTETESLTLDPLGPEKQ